MKEKLLLLCVIFTVCFFLILIFSQDIKAIGIGSYAMFFNFSDGAFGIAALSLDIFNIYTYDTNSIGNWGILFSSSFIFPLFPNLSYSDNNSIMMNYRHMFFSIFAGLSFPLVNKKLQDSSLHTQISVGIESVLFFTLELYNQNDSNSSFPYFNISLALKIRTINQAIATNLFIKNLTGFTLYKAIYVPDILFYCSFSYVFYF